MKKKLNFEVLDGSLYFQLIIVYFIFETAIMAQKNSVTKMKKVSTSIFGGIWDANAFNFPTYTNKLTGKTSPTCWLPESKVLADMATRESMRELGGNRPKKFNPFRFVMYNGEWLVPQKFAPICINCIDPDEVCKEIRVVDEQGKFVGLLKRTEDASTKKITGSKIVDEKGLTIDTNNKKLFL